MHILSTDVIVVCVVGQMNNKGVGFGPLCRRGLLAYVYRGVSLTMIDY